VIPIFNYFYLSTVTTSYIIQKTSITTYGVMDQKIGNAKIQNQKLHNVFRESGTGYGTVTNRRYVRYGTW
jgi:hypothetical protein